MGFVDSEKKNNKMHQEPYPYIILVFGVMYCYYTAVWSSFGKCNGSIQMYFLQTRVEITQDASCVL